MTYERVDKAALATETHIGGKRYKEKIACHNSR